MHFIFGSVNESRTVQLDNRRMNEGRWYSQNNYQDRLNLQIDVTEAKYHERGMDWPQMFCGLPYWRTFEIRLSECTHQFKRSSMALLNVSGYAIPYIIPVRHKYWIFNDFPLKFFPSKSLIFCFYELCMKTILTIESNGNNSHSLGNNS